MSKEAKAKLLKYGCCVLFIGLLAYLYLNLHSFSDADLSNKLRLLCDAFTIPGLLLIMFGGLLWASNEGAMDGLGYVLGRLARTLVPGDGIRKHERYADYVERKRNNPVRGFSFLFIAGGVSLAVSIVFLVLFYTM